MWRMEWVGQEWTEGGWLELLLQAKDGGGLDKVVVGQLEVFQRQSLLVLMS
jgi:hypothetical protein